MLIKIVIVSILVICSYMLGEYIYSTYTKRNKQLNELIRILEIMRADLSFGLYTLEEMFFRISQKKDHSFSDFFGCMNDDLSNNKNNTLEEIINKNINKIENDTYLCEKEVEELKKLIVSLGQSDAYSQERIIDLTIQNLKKITEETSDDVVKKGLVYKKVTTIIGVVVGIILM